MKIISFEAAGQKYWGAQSNGRAIDLNGAHMDRGIGMELAPSVLDFIRAGPPALDAARDTLAWLGDKDLEDVTFPLSQVHLLAPIPRTPKVIGIGLNYIDHARESGQEPPPNPIIFAKFSNSVIGPYDTIRIFPDVTKQPDYEAELGVVIGKTAHKVRVADALDYVFGYTVVDDVSARDVQLGAEYGRQWVLGKSLDTFCPMGPSITTRDEVPDPQALTVRSILNGQVMQDGNTHDMIFNVAALISYISKGMTLEPGDVIATGTPKGVGQSRKPPVFLKKGDVIEIEVGDLGKLSNPVEE